MKYFSGTFLIVLGVIVLATKSFETLDAYLRGAVDSVLTLILIGLAALTIAVAFLARPSLKALIILWIIAP